MLRTLGLAAVLFASFSGFAPAARAQAPDEEARQLFASGTHEYDAARYDQALALFQEAYERSHRSGLLYNIGLCHDRLSHDREALEAFQQFLAAEPTSPHHTEVEVRIRTLREAIARQDAAAAAAAANAQAEATHVPTPDETAHTDAAAHTAPAPVAPPARGVNVLEEWWFWTLVGVVVVGGAVAVGLSVYFSRGTEQPVDPGGGIFRALTEGP